MYWKSIALLESTTTASIRSKRLWLPQLLVFSVLLSYIDLFAFSDAKFNILILGTGFRNLEMSVAHSS